MLLTVMCGVSIVCPKNMEGLGRSANEVSYPLSPMRITDETLFHSTLKPNGSSPFECR